MMLSPVRGLRPGRDFVDKVPKAGDRDGLAAGESIGDGREHSIDCGVCARPGHGRLGGYSGGESWALVMRVLLQRLARVAYHAGDRTRPWHLWRIGVSGARGGNES